MVRASMRDNTTMGQTRVYPGAGRCRRLARLASWSCIIVSAVAAPAVVGCDGRPGRATTRPARGTDATPERAPTTDGVVQGSPALQPTMKKASRAEFDVP